MARFFKPLLGAVALAAATLTSTAALAAYNYNTQITITAPKGSTAEAAAKNKALPTGVKVSTCAADINVGSISIKNPDFLNFAIKYDAGKGAEIGDVFLVLQNLTEGATVDKYYLVSRANGVGGGLSLLAGALTAITLDAALVTAIAADVGAPNTGLPPGTFLAAKDNLGSGAQTEILFGGNLALAGLPKGLWSMTTVIAKAGATYEALGAETNSTFMFSRPETWGAHDTVVFELGTPFGVAATTPSATATNLVDYLPGTLTNGLTPQQCQ